MSGPGLSDKNIYARTEEKRGVVATKGMVTETPRLFILRKRKTLEKAGPAKPARQNNDAVIHKAANGFRFAIPA